jgi:hypothetical protein
MDRTEASCCAACVTASDVQKDGHGDCRGAHGPSHCNEGAAPIGMHNRTHGTKLDGHKLEPILISRTTGTTIDGHESEAIPVMDWSHNNWFRIRIAIGRGHLPQGSHPQIGTKCPILNAKQDQCILLVSLVCVTNCLRWLRSIERSACVCVPGALTHQRA